PVLAGAAAIPAAASAPSLAERVEDALPTLWAGASLLLLGAIAAAAGVLRRRRRAWRKGQLANVPVLVSDGVGPAVVGFVRPAIVVPRWTLKWAEPMQLLVVAHESEHIRARDPLLVLAATAAAALVPWNPAVWWQLRRLRLAVEVDCDARTLRSGADVANYGDLLLRVGARGSGLALPAAAFAEPRSFLERRIRAMTTRTPRNRAARAALFAALTLGVAAAGYALPAPTRPALFGRFLPGEIHARAVMTPADTTPVLDLSEVDVLPRLANGPEAARAIEQAYPRALKERGRGGMMMVDMVVRADGTPSLTIPASDPTGFEVAAYTAARQFRFQPARKGGVPVAVRLSLPVSFGLNGKEPPSPVSVQTEIITTVSTDTVVIPVPAGGMGPDTVRQPAVEIGRAEVKPAFANPAEIRDAIESAYPASLRDAGIGGTVLLDMVVERDGTVREARVVSSDHPRLTEPARTVASRIRFAPLRDVGHPVTLHFQLPVTFRARPAGA
ncbi:MAG: M56 family metallopeptidase, partial [Gemmatimonadetes bacterium]|nr:M56 family metallopeptidase [Gemmatimonadota bacterium]